MAQTDTKDQAFKIVGKFLVRKGIKRNSITGYFERGGRPLSEQEINSLFIEVKNENPQSRGLNKQNFDICMNSDDVESFNPLRDFFKENAKIKGQGAIRNLVSSLDIIPSPELEKIGGTKTVVENLFKKWLVGCVASIYEHNYNCLMFVLIGRKGCGKTEFFRRIMPEQIKGYFAQSKLADGKDSEALMCEKLIILNDELDGLHSKEARTFRSFISANYYTHRPPWGRQNVTRKRLASVCGASNDRNIILDAENNRRIIPVEINSVNHTTYNSVNKVELFMEAYHLFISGSIDWNLSAKEMDALDSLSESFEVPTLEYELLQKYFRASDPQMEMTASEIKAHIETETHQRLSLHKIGSNLKRLGFRSKMVKDGGKSKQVYSVTKIY